MVGQRQAHHHRVGRKHLPQIGARRDILAQVRILGADTPVERCGDAGALQVQTGRLQGGLGGGQLGTGLGQLRLAQGQGGGFALAELGPFTRGQIRLGLFAGEGLLGLGHLGRSRVTARR